MSEIQPSSSAGRTAPTFPIVGVGSSAGGLEAFKKHFPGMPCDSGAAFVLVPHLDPNHESLLVELLTRYTKMPVLEANEGMVVEANHVYILPPNKYMTIADGVLRLTGPVLRGGLQTSIDLFLRALAEDQQDRAIGIILSGTGSHGTLGLVAIKAKGGMAMAQDPSTAEFSSMPQAAIATGLIDHVLAVEEMPAALTKYLQHSYTRGEDIVRDSAKDADRLNQVLAILRDRSKVDFRCYRKRVFKRRVERRMGLAHFEQLTEYLALLRKQPDEVLQLARDLLISVTSFFRDAEAFRTLQAEVLTQLVQLAKRDAVLRVWVPGCATGEEAYSIAMLLIELLATAGKHCRLQIFATDADAKALEIARQGKYPLSISVDISAERLARFFTQIDESTFQVNKEVREAVVFASHNLISDAPFSKMDLISCRNVLIYLEPEVQTKVISLLHFSLNQEGHLFLGSSETAGAQTEQFETISKQWRIYRRMGTVRPDRVEFPITRGVESFSPAPRIAESIPLRTEGYAEITKRLLLSELAPAAVLINRKFEILYYLGPTTQYLDVPTGEPTKDLITLARDGLRTQLRIALPKAVDSGQPVRLAEVRMKRNDSYVPVSVTITPAQATKAADGYLLVRFEDVGEAEPQLSASLLRVSPLPSDEALLRQLESELQVAKDDLQNNTIRMNSANKELHASNEEIVSMNEELQSANEELETSKEEMQSLNEELITVNSELQERVHELELTNNDVANLLTSTNIATVFLDTRFCIKRFTASAAALLNLIATDVGRPFENIQLTIDDDALFADARRVLHGLMTLEREVKAEHDHWYIRRVLPYRTLLGNVEGVVITFTNVTQLKEAEARIHELNDALKRRIIKRGAQLKESDRKLQENVVEVDRLNIDQREQVARMDAIVRTAADGIVTFDEAGLIGVFNPAAERIFGYTAAEAHGRNVATLLAAPYTFEQDGYLDGGNGHRRETVGRRKDGSTFAIDLAISKIRDSRGGFTGFIRDISERKAIEREVLDAVTAEQRRIGQDLHDNTGQTLTGLGLMARSLVEMLNDKARPEAPLAIRIAEGISLALGQIRAWSRGLVLIDLDSKGLDAALQGLANQAELLHGIRCDVSYDKSLPDLDNTTATHLFRIVQEALTNAVRHSHASNILIHARPADHGKLIVLSIADDGRGLKPPSEEDRGIGLRIMFYRAHLIGATLVVEPGEDNGTIVTCRLPYHGTLNSVVS